MQRFRTTLGLVAGIILVASSAAHSLLGWPDLRSKLAKAALPAELQFAVKIGWLFGGLMMLALGVIVIELFAARLRREVRPSFPAAVIGAAYLAFGGWALVASGFDPFFYLFVVPGVLLAIAAPAAAS